MEDSAADAVFLQRGRYLLVAAQAEYGLVCHQQDGFEPKLPADAADLPTGSEALGHGGLWQGDLPDYLAGELPDDFSEFIKCHDKKLRSCSVSSVPAGGFPDGLLQSPVPVV